MLVAPWTIFAPGGVSSVVANLGAALERSLHWEVHYLELAGSDADPERREGPRVFRRKIRPLPPARATLRGRLAFTVTLLPTLLRMLVLLRRHRITVINVHYPTPEAWLFAAMRRYGLFRGRLILSIHGSDIRGTMVHEEHLGVMRRTYTAADAIVACSNSLARDVPLLAPSLSECTHAIHNGFGPTAVPMAADRSPSRPSTTPASEPRILSVAAFEPKKGLDILVQAFAICRAAHPCMRLRMIGQSHAGNLTYQDLVQQVAALGIAEHVEFSTDLPHEQVMAAIAAADVFVLPSRLEPFGLVLLEAGGTGTPIVASNVDGIPEVIPSDDYGVLVPPDDPAALADAILRVLQDPAAARRRADNMQRRVRQQFTWDVAAAGYEKLIRSLRRAP